jgi:hypothetical protein
MRLDKLAATTPGMTTSLISTLARRFTGDFSRSLALIGAFRAFSIVEIFFFSMVPTKIACAFNNFFTALLASLRFYFN